MNNQTEQFTEWVVEEYQRRDLSMRKLAKRMGYSHSAVSLTLSGQTEVTWGFCAAVARAFGISPVEVFRRAGLLPARSELSERVAEVVSRHARY